MTDVMSIARIMTLVSCTRVRCQTPALPAIVELKHGFNVSRARHELMVKLRHYLIYLNF